MHLSVYLPFAVSLLFAIGTRPTVRRLPPRSATWGLTLGSVVAAVASTWGLILLASTLIGSTPEAAERFRFSATLFRMHDPVPPLAALIALAAVLGGTGRGVVAGWRRRLAERATRRGLADHGCNSELVVIDDRLSYAFALPRRLRSPGRIIASSGMLRSLGGAERRVLLAHERAHIEHRHHLFTAVADAAASANPLLIRTRNDICFAIERWADEDAARAVGDRGVAEAALTKAALGGAGPDARVGLAFHESALVERIVALQHDPPRHRPLYLALWLGLAVAAAVGVCDATIGFAHLVDGARHSTSGVARDATLRYARNLLNGTVR